MGAYSCFPRPDCAAGCTIQIAEVSRPPRTATPLHQHENLEKYPGVSTLQHSASFQKRTSEARSHKHGTCWRWYRMITRYVLVHESLSMPSVGLLLSYGCIRNWWCSVVVRTSPAGLSTFRHHNFNFERMLRKSKYRSGVNRSALGWVSEHAALIMTRCCTVDPSV